MDDAKLDKLIEQLASDLIGYMGARKFPRKLRLDEASAIAERMQDEADKGVTIRAEKVAQSGDVIACKQGCNGCCEEPIMVFRPEAARVWRWLQLPENKEVRTAFLAAYRPWKVRMGETVAALSRLFMDDETYLSAHVAAWQLRVLCPFNRDGDCSIYPVRPITCRTAHALTTHEHCHGGSAKPAERVTFVPLDQFVIRSRQLMWAANNAMPGGRSRPEALPDLVFAMLQA